MINWVIALLVLGTYFFLGEVLGLSDKEIIVVFALIFTVVMLSIYTISFIIGIF